MTELITIAIVVNFLVPWVSTACPSRAVVSDTTVAKLLEIFRKQDRNPVNLQGVSGHVRDYVYDDVTASKFNVSRLISRPQFRRYCLAGRDDIVEVDYTFSAKVSALWWRRGDSGSFDAHIQGVGMVVHYVVGHSECDGSAWLCTNNVDVSGMGRPNLTMKVYDGNLDVSSIEAARKMLEIEEPRLIRKIKGVLRREVLACGGSLPRNERNLQEKRVVRRISLQQSFV
nr:uncharacterized protein LOC129385666 [Dermacentor andersoni]